MSYTGYLYLFVFLELSYLFYIAVPLKYRWIELLVVSLVFYFFSSKWLVLFMVLCGFIVYFAGLFLNKINDGFSMARKALPKEERKDFKALINWQKRAVVTVAVLAIFGILIYLKYYNFLLGSLTGAMKFFGFSAPFKHLKLILPLGISYYTLMAASYIIDVYRGKYRAETNPFKIILFLCFFPHITEGPIGRYDLLGPQLIEGHRASYKNFTYGTQLILWGLFKKIVIADRAASMVSTVFKNYTDYSGVVVLLAAVMFTVQIYAEFSGCIDVVTGSAQLFGISLQSNFERPFFSKSINEFWRRWHITLGAWLRDYVFYAVSLSKPFMNLSKWAKKHFSEYYAAMIPALFALFFVWFGNGFWHGAGEKYILYGLYYYFIMALGMIMEPLFVKFFSTTGLKRDGRLMNCLKTVRTIMLVVIGMLMFRATSMKAFYAMFGSIFKGFSFEPIINGAIFKLGTDAHDYLIIAVGVVVMLIVGLLKERGHSIRAEVASMNLALRWVIYLALILSIIIFGAYGTGYGQVDPIYAQF